MGICIVSVSILATFPVNCTRPDFAILIVKGDLHKDISCLLCSILNWPFHCFHVRIFSWTF